MKKSKSAEGDEAEVTSSRRKSGRKYDTFVMTGDMIIHTTAESNRDDALPPVTSSRSDDVTPVRSGKRLKDKARASPATGSSSHENKVTSDASSIPSKSKLPKLSGHTPTSSPKLRQKVTNSPLEKSSHSPALARRASPRASPAVARKQTRQLPRATSPPNTTLHSPNAAKKAQETRPVVDSASRSCLPKPSQKASQLARRLPQSPKLGRHVTGDGGTGRTAHYSTEAIAQDNSSASGGEGRHGHAQSEAEAGGLHSESSDDLYGKQNVSDKADGGTESKPALAPLESNTCSAQARLHHHPQINDVTTSCYSDAAHASNHNNNNTQQRSSSETSLQNQTDEFTGNKFHPVTSSNDAADVTEELDNDALTHEYACAMDVAREVTSQGQTSLTASNENVLMETEVVTSQDAVSAVDPNPVAVAATTPMDSSCNQLQTCLETPPPSPDQIPFTAEPLESTQRPSAGELDFDEDSPFLRRPLPVYHACRATPISLDIPPDDICSEDELMGRLDYESFDLDDLPPPPAHLLSTSFDASHYIDDNSQLALLPSDC